MIIFIRSLVVGVVCTFFLAGCYLTEASGPENNLPLNHSKPKKEKVSHGSSKSTVPELLAKLMKEKTTFERDHNTNRLEQHFKQTENQIGKHKKKGNFFSSKKKVPPIFIQHDDQMSFSFSPTSLSLESTSLLNENDLPLMPETYEKPSPLPVTPLSIPRYELSFPIKVDSIPLQEEQEPKQGDTLNEKKRSNKDIKIESKPKSTEKKKEDRA